MRNYFGRASGGTLRRRAEERASLLRIVLVLVFGGAVLAGGYYFLTELRTSKRVVSVAHPASGRGTASNTPAVAERINPRRIESTSRRAQESPISPPAGATAVPQSPDTSTPLTRELIERLAHVDVSHGPITPEQVKQWKQDLRELTTQGPAAVGAIRGFLAQNQDLNFAEIEGGSSVGYSSLRAGLFDVLKQIGGPEATEIFLQTLHTTADPVEIAMLARTLDEQAPGQYRQQALEAVRETLEQISTRQLAVKEVGPLFQMLQQYGEAQAVTELERTIPQWHYYAMMALAGMPSGEGIPVLVRQVENPEASPSRNFALQMLAQVSAQSPEAAAGLLEQARLNRVPVGAWNQIAAGLAGDQYQLEKPQIDSTTGGAAFLGLKGYHIEAGNQNFYSLPLLAERESDEVKQRLAVIDQLLAVSQNSIALQALQNARGQLTADKARP